MEIKQIILLLLVFSLIGALAGIPYGFQTRWGVESAYAKNDNGQGDNNDNQGEDGNNQGGKPVAVPEPSTLLLLGSGLLGLGLAIRRLKR